MKRKLRKIGNSIMIAITPSMLETTELKVGDTVDIIAKGKSIFITKIEKGEK